MRPKHTLKTKLWNIILEYHSIPYRKVYSYSNLDERYYFSGYYRTSKHYDILYKSYYYYTQVWKVGDCDIEDFVAFVSRDYVEYRYRRRSGWDWHPWCPWNKEWNPYPRQLWTEEYTWRRRPKRKRKKYQRKPNHVKKVLSDKEIDKREWKKRKKKKRPRYKCGYHNSPGEFYKWESKKAHRAWERNMIAHGRWDDMESFNSHRRIGCYYDWW